MTMLETLARATDPAGLYCPHQRAGHVRNLLLALRSPDEGMVEAMFDAQDEYPRALRMWQAAVDHILTSEAGK